MNKVTVKSSADLALIKYWGKKDEKLRLPENGSLSMVLSGLDTTTTVEFSDNLTKDEVIIQGESEPGESERVVEHLNRIRKLAGVSTFAKVVSQNSFPKGTGLSSSGSGFASLTLAATKALGLSLSQKEQSILARQGSGTACRCVCGGFVEWKDGDSSQASYSETIYPADHWDLRDVIAVVDEGGKKVSSTQGHKAAQSSIFFSARLSQIPSKIEKLKKIIGSKDFEAFGEMIEAEALEFHAILLTSKPPLMAWYPGTIEVMQAVAHLRSKGVPAYFSINTGFNIHVVTLPQYEAEVRKHIENLELVKKTITARVGNKPEYLSTHLF